MTKRNLFSLGEFIGFVVVALCASTSFAMELNSQQQEVMDAISAQLGHFYAKEWEEHETYIHPDFVSWGAYLPVPVPRSPNSRKLLRLANESSEVLGYNIIPLSVQVHGDTAVTNLIVRVWRKRSPEVKPNWLTLRLHNTWVKHDGRWLLYAVYNSREE